MTARTRRTKVAPTNGKGPQPKEAAAKEVEQPQPPSFIVVQSTGAADFVRVKPEELERYVEIFMSLASQIMHEKRTLAEAKPKGGAQAKNGAERDILDEDPDDGEDSDE